MIFIVLLKELIKEAKEKHGYNQGRHEKQMNNLQKNNTGFTRVCKVQSDRHEKKHYFRYTIEQNKKRTQINRSDLLSLKYEVERRGLPWVVSNVLIAHKTVNDEGYSWELFE